MDEKNNIEDMDKENLEPKKELAEEIENNAIANEESSQAIDSIPEEDVAKEASNAVEESHPLQIEQAPAVTYRWDYQEQKRAIEGRLRKTKKRGKFIYTSVFTLVFLLTVSLLVGALFLGETLGTRDGAASYGSLGDLYSECVPSYVALSVTTELGSGVGSGVIITSDGYIATNYHVVEDAVEISVIMNDGTTYDAEFIDGDELNDIAVIKVDAKNLPAAKLGSSKNSNVGDQVMAIGTPHSINYQGTMTSGYISALDRRFVEQNKNGTVKKVLYLIQTDTSVNPGNSGGPLFNMSGEVIGIVTLKIAGENYEGLGFALPMESVIDMINDIIRNGEITDPSAGGANQGAALGITGYAVTKDTKYLLSGEYHFRVILDEKTDEEVLIYPTVYGEIEIPISDEDTLAEYEIEDYSFYTAPETGICVVRTTEGFDSAQKLKKNDIIVSADGISCKQMSALQSLIADKRIGDEIEFEIFRDGKLITVAVELGKAASME